LIRKTKRFTEDEGRRYMLQILEATSYLHQHQIIHRDLKLGNVFLDRDWNIKMGDFGLATKLAQDSERKRTICGTPNYIAPEILEGKAGHSYQVDLWSAGVILYTMLVGRPPYESTDVKSTYRRILANVYTFPEAVPVSDSAKDLVGRLLQVKPELRPSLDDILNHPFLRNGGPRQRFSTSHGLRGSSASSSPPSSAVTSGGGSKSTASRLGSQKLSSTPERCAASGGFGRPPLKTRSSNVEAEAAAEGAGGGVPATAEGVARLAKPRPGTPGSTGKAGGDGGRDVLGGRHATSKRSTACPTSSRSVVPRTHNTKGFSVYCDTKEAAAGSRGRGAGASGGAQSNSSRRVASTAGSGRRGAAAAAAGAGAGAGNTEAAVKSPGGDKENDPRSAIGGGGTGGVRVPVNGPISRRPVVRSASSVGSSGRVSGRARAEGNSTGGGGAKGGLGGGGGGGGNRKASIRRSASAVGTQADHRRVASSAREAGGEYGSRGKKAAAAAAAASAAAAAAGAVTPRVRSSAASRGSAAAGSPPTPSPYRSSPLPGPASGGGGSRVSTRMVAVGDGATPRSQAKSRGDARQRLDFGSTPRSTRQRGSPAAAAAGPSSGGGGGRHATGSSAPSRSGAARGTRASAAAAAAAREAAREAASENTPPPPAPTVWVTRYVDYSTKYGLGFLLSDGSAGVYFNDATKIVLEPAGVAFEYIERTRRSTSSSPSSGGGTAGDQPPRARHTLEDFPQELQKKVTLLNHFRGYLHELVKKGKDGGSSCEGKEEEAVSAQGDGEGRGEPLTFLRKWLRTRNAILFRLSNRTVQVVFADHTEILLSKEARVVTFVDKHGNRQTHSLQGVLQDQR
ncbi:unnamed protein product, partial [Ectocarpus fasciculatus]